ncbi:MAG: PSD1 and planctomycete cytochrome C domain-containing protein [Pirellulales bacterium]|nr:PSD1 and planctomycete cytochrome C domain-containing protein [Pirellulales bacterium]
MFVQRCHKCHARASENESEFSVASREGLLTGGERGPAIVPGDSSASLLVQALEHTAEGDLKMPPSGKLPAEQIAAVRAWIDAGAVWPEAHAKAAGPKHWSFEPPAETMPPAVADDTWIVNDVDRFIAAQHAAHGLRPAPEADRRALIRRVTYDLTGLPPTPEEIDQFLADASPRAYETLVDRLLASPRYGERWARHWLDLVHYSDTNGLDNDHSKPNAYRYRDYVIQAMQADLPYDQFVREQIAGDLLADPRPSDDGGHDWAPLGTGALWLGAMLNVPVDQPVALANEMENRIDTLGKAFLGLTLACARCHDHKFDDIPATDYYALAGILESTTNVQACVNTAERNRAIAEQESQLLVNAQAARDLLERPDLRQQWLAPRLEAAQRTAEYLLEARRIWHDDFPDEARDRKQLAARGLDYDEARRWYQLLTGSRHQSHPVFVPWIKLLRVNDDRFDRRIRTIGDRLLEFDRLRREHQQTWVKLEDFEEPQADGWESTGAAFPAVATTDLPTELVGAVGQGVCASATRADAAVGRLVRRDVHIEHRYLTFLIAGDNAEREAGLNLIFNSQVLPEPRDVCATGEGTMRLSRRWFNVQPYRGHDVTLEIVDERSEPGGRVFVDELQFTDESPFPAEWPSPNRLILEIFTDPQVTTPQQAAQRIEDAIVGALQAAAAQYASRAGSTGPAPNFRLADADLHEIFVAMTGPDSPLVAPSIEEFLPPAEREELAQLTAQRNELEATYPSSVIGIVSRDRSPHNMRLHRSGDPHNPGDEVPRGYVAALCQGHEPPPQTGSGRLELADWLASSDNPLTARVAVNRIWHHHFGRGLVATPDNFGMLGEPPSHPELLDWLARWFIDQGWSFKALHRLLVTSNTYRQSSQADQAMEQFDADNAWLHRMPLRRLEAECVRDALLAVAGNLNEARGGPPVPLHLDKFDVGEDLPLVSGPLDGDRRRSIYQEVRTNHLSELLRAFDLPGPSETIGARESSVVANQSLALMNNALVAQQALAWAERLASIKPPEQRIERMYVEALGRPPTAVETSSADQFLAAQRVRYEQQGQAADAAGRLAWTDLCQVMFNLAEFVYVP